MPKVVAMVLAGGRGKRMDALCSERPKPALPFAGKFRVIDFSLSNCRHSEINHIAVLTDYQRAYLANYLGRWNRANPGGNCHTLEPETGSYRGTADAVYQNLGYLRKNGADRVLVLAGDHVYKMDYRKMLAFHEQVKADVTVGVVRVPREEAHRFGTVTTSDESRIVDFVEKSPLPASNLVSMGMYLFNREVLERRLAEDAAEPDSPHDFGYAVIPSMVKQDRVFAYKFDGYWQDIGTASAYYTANMEVTREKPLLSLNGTWPILTEANNALPPRVLQGGSVQNSTISPGCVIKGRVENSLLSPGVVVEEQAVVKNSVLMSGVRVGQYSVVDHSILDEAVDVSKFCFIGFRAGIPSGDSNITVLESGLAVPPHTAIGCNGKVLTRIGWKPAHTGTATPKPASVPLFEEKIAVSEPG